MFKETEPTSQFGHEITKLLIRERRRDLRRLDRQYALKKITLFDYQSCRDALSGTIAELIKLQRTITETDLASAKDREASN
jgi:hypothetical protein